MSNVVGIVIGVILIIYFVGTASFGIFIQYKSKKQNSDMFGEYPATQIVFHCLISLCFVLACFVAKSVVGVFLGIGFATWVIKNCVDLYILREHKAFKNIRSASETEAFLNNIRSKVPVAQFYCSCSHNRHSTHRDVNGKTTTRTETIVTYTETRYVQILGIIDNTPALYVVGSSPLIYLKLKEQIQWLGNSQMIINQLSAMMYLQNKFRDTHCSVMLSVEVPGLTPQNYLKRGEYPSWINQGLLWASSLLQFDVLYICMLRSRIPKTQLPVVKSCSIDPTFQINQPPQQLTIDQIQLPSFDQMCPAEINSIQLPPILEENTQPLLTDIKPPYFDNFDSISVPKYDAYSGDGLVQTEQQYTVEHGAVI
ncbi:Transmembrane_domain-containing protein [Hexamita inflata]|uniref:Transmembrane domain-containing protein n=1 Tax=Hexamita inflata TaxID=28002 RepID=A0AA86RIV6_9EUKA|nr:Transmembrane domain-containing protein [Hexamita inflata]